MAIGLKRGTVELADHDPEWEKLAAETIQRLWRVFGSVAKDIQHVGSTSIKTIKAKPVIDIAVAVDIFDDVLPLSPMLEEQGFVCVGWESNGKIQPMYQCGEFVSGEKLPIILTHYIHIVIADSEQWNDYINHRDYMNACPAAAHEYEMLKLRLASEYQNSYHDYFIGKQDHIQKTVEIAHVWDEFGRIFIKIEPVTKGWSDDKKYYIETAYGKRMLLRISDISEHDRKKAEYEMMQKIASYDIPMSNPVDFGLCNGGKSVYTLSTWIDGEDAEAALERMSEAEQYNLGIKAGELLRKIHAIPAPDDAVDWKERYFTVIDERVDAYRSEGIPFEGSTIVLEYLEGNRCLLDSRPQCFLHGDYHEGNLMVDTNGELFVIDWLDDGFGNHGDPWHDFQFDKNDYYSTGLLRGYFGGEPPEEFWNVITYYIFTKALTSIVWMKYHRPDEIQENINWNELNARLIKEGHLPLTKWYLKDFYIQWVDGIPYKLKTPFDFSFLSKYGKVFKVFDGQDSGNICFGVADGNTRYFVKFAGAPTAEYTGTIESAIERLKAAVAPYRDLAHPALIKFIIAEEISGGFAIVFEWVDAVCAHRMYPIDHQKFKQITLKSRIVIFEDILDFHRLVAEKGYTAVDFYDGSIMWDFVNERTVICDIDFYTKGKAYGNKALWGHMIRTSSPEERVDGVLIDEISNVYNMGAIAFVLFTNSDQSPETWPLSPERYAVVKKAVSDQRGDRQQSIEQLIEEWRAAKK